MISVDVYSVVDKSKKKKNKSTGSTESVLYVPDYGKGVL